MCNADLRDLLRFMCQPGALPPGVSATVQCFSGVQAGLVSPAEPSEQNRASQRSVQQPAGAAHTSAAATIALSSISQCKTFLCNALELFARVMTETPATFAATVPPDAILAVVDLLAHAGFSVRPIATRRGSSLLLHFVILWLSVVNRKLDILVLRRCKWQQHMQQC